MMIQVESRRDRSKWAIDHFRVMAGFDGRNPAVKDTAYLRIYNELVDLHDCNPDDVDNVISKHLENSKWTYENCDQCGGVVDQVAILNGSEWDMCYCKSCISDAFNKIEEKE